MTFLQTIQSLSRHAATVSGKLSSLAAVKWKTAAETPEGFKSPPTNSQHYLSPREIQQTKQKLSCCSVASSISRTRCTTQVRIPQLKVKWGSVKKRSVPHQQKKKSPPWKNTSTHTLPVFVSALHLLAFSHVLPDSCLTDTSSDFSTQMRLSGGGIVSLQNEYYRGRAPKRHGDSSRQRGGIMKGRRHFLKPFVENFLFS